MGWGVWACVCKTRRRKAIHLVHASLPRRGFIVQSVSLWQRRATQATNDHVVKAILGHSTMTRPSSNLRRRACGRRTAAVVLAALIALAGLLATVSSSAAAPFDWQTATPESQGMSRAKLDALKDELAKRKTRAFLIIRNDQIVYEWYAPGHAAQKPHGTASLAKAIVAGLSLGVALTDGKITLDDPAAKYIPQWKGDPRKSKITIRQLGAHTSGLEDAEADNLPHDKLTGWKGDFWKRFDVPNDPFTISRDRTPLLFDPGAKFQYSNLGIGLLTYCVTAAIKDGEHRDSRALLRDRVMRPIGVPDAEWACGYGKTFTVDGLPLVGSWGGGNYTARAAARIGRLVLRDGDWDSKRILSKEAIRQITTDAGLPGNCGMGWWTNAAGRYPYLPKDAVWGAGAGDQVLLVIPSLQLIAVRNGETLAPPPAEVNAKKLDVFAQYHDPRAKILFEPLLDALTDGSTLPAPCQRRAYAFLGQPGKVPRAPFRANFFKRFWSLGTLVFVGPCRLRLGT